MLYRNGFAAELFMPSLPAKAWQMVQLCQRLDSAFRILFMYSMMICHIILWNNHGWRMCKTVYPLPIHSSHLSEKGDIIMESALMKYRAFLTAARLGSFTSAA